MSGIGCKLRGALLGVLAAALMPGCRVGSDSIHERDSGELWPELRISWQVHPKDRGTLRSLFRAEEEDEGAAGPAEEESPPRVKTWTPGPGPVGPETESLVLGDNTIFALDLELTGLDGSLVHRVGRNDLEFGGAVYDPFAVVDVDYRLIRGVGYGR